MNTIEIVKQVRTELQSELAATKETPTPERVERFRLHFLGRKGRIPALMEQLKTASKEDRPVLGKEINLLRQEAEAQVEDLKKRAGAYLIEKKLAQDPIDISLPVSSNVGSLHPVSLMRQELTRVFHHMGFTIYDAPEIEYEFFNFTALNVPDNHPARDMQDTFYIDGHKDMVLRTHTSNVQIHSMLNEKPPLRIAAPGRVFRCDSDATHTPMFHQIEGFIVDKGINFSHLKGTIDEFLKAIYGPQAKSRFRPSFFPFVEPGAEFDMQCGLCAGKGCSTCKNTGWLEIGGCGMIHPNVFETVGIDSAVYSGFAFGFGIDRMAMVKYGLNDLRQLFDGDYKFLKQFPIYYQ